MGNILILKVGHRYQIEKKMKTNITLLITLLLFNLNSLL